MCLSDIAGERVGAGDDDAPAASEEKEEEDDAAVARGARQGEKDKDDQAEADDEAGLFAKVVEKRADAERGEHEAERLSESDGPILARRELEASGEVGKDGPQHGSNHAVDENRNHSGEDQQGLLPFRRLVQTTGTSIQLRRWLLSSSALRITICRRPSAKCG